MRNGALQPRFIKPFIKGQITLPKDFREYLGIIRKDGWLKVSLWNQQILVQPVKNLQEIRIIKPKVDTKTYLKILLEIKGD